MILTTSIATAAAKSYECPWIWQFWPVAAYKLIKQQEGMASIFQSQEHWLND